jgi:predicted ATPase
MNAMPVGMLTWIVGDWGTVPWAAPDGGACPGAAELAAARAALEAASGYVYLLDEQDIGAAFTTAGAALKGAFDLRAVAGPHAERLRLAAHTGQADLRDGSYAGSDMERAAQILAAAHPGQTLVASATRELARDSLDPGLSLKELGSHRLPDLLPPRPLYQLAPAGWSAPFPPPLTLDRHPHNLPVQQRRFVGRAHELAEAGRLLEAARLLTLTGAEGSGKSRLALQLAADRIGACPDGAWLVDLSSLASPALVPQAVAAALGLRETADRSPQATLLDWLRRRRLLLVLDNCEHLRAAAGGLAEALLRDCPQVRVIATSREPLGVAGEVELPVPPLALPLYGGFGEPIQALSQYDAVELFLDRASLARPGFEVNNDNLPGIAQICHRLEGIPLAIELAAASLNRLEVDPLMAQVDAWFDRFTGAQPLSLPRDLVLRAAIELSYLRLEAGTARLLHRLAVFPGAFGATAAGAVCADASDRRGLFVAEGLAQLEQAAWLVVQRGTQPRLHLHEALRQFALEKLIATGEDRALRDRHLFWAVNLARSAGEALSGAYPVAALRQLEAEHDNLRAALAWGLARTETAAQAQSLAAGLGSFWNMRGHYREGLDWLERVLSPAPADGDPADHALAAYWSGALAWRLGDYGRAEARSREAIAGFQGLDDRRREAWALGSLGAIALNRGDARRAELLLEQRLAVARGSSPPQELAFAFSDLGEAARAQGDLARAGSLYQEGLDQLRLVSRDTPSPLACVPLHNLGQVRLSQGDVGAAGAALRDCLTMCRTLGDPAAMAMALAGMAGVAVRAGDAVRAARLLGAADRLLDDVGSRLDRTDLVDRDRHAELARAALGDPAWTEAYDAGRTLGAEEATALALGEG